MLKAGILTHVVVHAIRDAYLFAKLEAVVAGQAVVEIKLGD